MSCALSSIVVHTYLKYSLSIRREIKYFVDCRFSHLWKLMYDVRLLYLIKLYTQYCHTQFNYYNFLMINSLSMSLWPIIAEYSNNCPNRYYVNWLWNEFAAFINVNWSAYRAPPLQLCVRLIKRYTSRCYREIEFDTITHPLFWFIIRGQRLSRFSTSSTWIEWLYSKKSLCAEICREESLD